MVGSEHINQLSMVCVAVLKRQAEVLTGLPVTKAHMRAVPDLRQFGILQRVCEHSRCPAAINTEATESVDRTQEGRPAARDHGGLGEGPARHVTAFPYACFIYPAFQDGRGRGPEQERTQRRCAEEPLRGSAACSRRPSQGLPWQIREVGGLKQNLCGTWCWQQARLLRQKKRKKQKPRKTRLLLKPFPA